MVTWHEATIIRIENETPTTKRFWLNVDNAEKITFKAGQFVIMDLPISERRLKRWRSYSIASAPNENNILEFCIVKFEGGEGTKYLFETAKVGTIIRFKGPEGAFYLPEIIKKDLVFICTGTGVAPFRSMIFDIYNNQKSHQKIHLIFGARYAEDILYRKEFEQLSNEMKDFSYDIALSREQKWSGYKGHLHQIYLSHYAEPNPDVDFYICGWSKMIDETIENLLVKLRYDRKQIHYELYG